MTHDLPELGELELKVMQLVWAHAPISAELVRERLDRRLKESTVRTVLRRLEEKGYLAHEADGRTFVYRALDARQNVAVRAVKGIIDRFCGGSAEQLLIGLVDHSVLDKKQLERLTRKIAERTKK